MGFPKKNTAQMAEEMVKKAAMGGKGHAKRKRPKKPRAPKKMGGKMGASGKGPMDDTVNGVDPNEPDADDSYEMEMAKGQTHDIYD